MRESLQDLIKNTPHLVNLGLCLLQNFFKLVDELLCELVAEMGITREQFKAACEQSASNPTHHRIVQQILNVDDFEAFKKMMIKKNMQINEIAMQELLKKQGGGVQEEAKVEAPSQAPIPDTPATASNDEDEQMRLALEMSKVA